PKRVLLLRLEWRSLRVASSYPTQQSHKNPTSRHVVRLESPKTEQVPTAPGRLIPASPVRPSGQSLIFQKRQHSLQGALLPCRSDRRRKLPADLRPKAPAHFSKLVAELRGKLPEKTLWQ